MSMFYPNARALAKATNPYAANGITVSGPGTLRGTDGDDILISAVGTARDSSGTLYGGLGNDAYYIESPYALVTEYAGEGVDTVYTSMSYMLVANVENLVLTGAAIGGNGNELNNHITGNDVGNELRGYSGDDTLLGLGGNDTLYGFADNDLLDGGAGHDTLYGGDGDDTLLGGVGNDRIDGGDGNDTLVLAGLRSDYAALSDGDRIFFIGPDGAVQLSGVEQVRFVDASVSLDQAVAGAAPFDGLRYIASHADLIRAFGADTEAGARHFILYGFAEGRSTSTFNALEYLASNPDLARIYYDNADAGVRHYINYGAAEGRPTNSFDARAYLAANADLAAIFGNNEAAGLRHYLYYGAREGRPTEGFDGQAYLAANTDLLRIFGNDANAGVQHYLNYGVHEGRPINGFDAVGYLLSNPDLQSAGFGATGAYNHWLVYGANEGRGGDAAFGREQVDHVIDIGDTASAAIDQGGDHDWFQFNLDAGRPTHVELSAAFATTVTVHDMAGHLVSTHEIPSGQGGFDITTMAGGDYYLTVQALDPSTAGNYAVTIG
jgi:Ca2+-binding RTX toxin-like protein